VWPYYLEEAKEQPPPLLNKNNKRKTVKPVKTNTMNSHNRYSYLLAAASEQNLDRGREQRVEHLHNIHIELRRWFD
jgi:hypothetical protein